ncbi:MAG: hypothetical protein JRH18_13840 [Deltaproteobacteria bacterium]|nr:hypothetical protein [Deltaproteobacteria bacterium]MBW2152737.1 hypothetical protein [Deltaproteobacteria bacterium]
MEPLAPHEKLFIDYEFLEEDEDHGEIGCVTCHGGNPDDPNWKTAHKDLVKDPSFPEPDACIECHEEESENYSQNLHISNRPMYLMVMARASADPTIQARLNTAHKAHCTQCHSSCGQCHLSRPGSVGGGDCFRAICSSRNRPWKRFAPPVMEAGLETSIWAKTLSAHPMCIT